MRIFMQHTAGGNAPLRYVHLTLQADLFGGWELLRESGQIGGSTQLRRDQYLQPDEAGRAFEKARNIQLKRGFQLITTDGADATR